MTKKIGDKKLTGVKSTTHTSEVAQTDPIAGIKHVKAASEIGGVKGAGAVGRRRPTRVMTIEEREQLLAMINEEADKMFNSGLLPPQKREVVTKAVKMAVDASLVTQDEAEEKEKTPRHEPEPDEE